MAAFPNPLSQSRLIITMTVYHATIQNHINRTDPVKYKRAHSLYISRDLGNRTLCGLDPWSTYNYPTIAADCPRTVTCKSCKKTKAFRQKYPFIK